MKRGDTFDYSSPIRIVDGDGNTVDMTGWSVASSVKLPDNSTVELTADWTDATNTAVRLQYADTSAWPAGVAYIDIEFTSGGGAIVSTDTASFVISEDLT